MNWCWSGWRKTRLRQGAAECLSLRLMVLKRQSVMNHLDRSVSLDSFLGRIFSGNVYFLFSFKLFCLQQPLWLWMFTLGSLTLKVCSLIISYPLLSLKYDIKIHFKSLGWKLSNLLLRFIKEVKNGFLVSKRHWQLNHVKSSAIRILGSYGNLLKEVHLPDRFCL